MKTKLFLVAFVFLSALTTQARATDVWTVTTTGTIQFGHDATGVFGTVVDLTGLSYTQSITSSIKPSDWEDSFTDESSLNTQSGRSPGFSSTVKINGKSATFTATWNVSGGQSLYNNYSVIDPERDGINSGHRGTMATGESLNATNSVYVYEKNLIPNVNFDQVLAPTDVSEASFFKFSVFSISGIRDVYFVGTPETIALNINAVPEPETYAMLLAGLAVVGAMARRRKSRRLPSS